MPCTICSIWGSISSVLRRHILLKPKFTVCSPLILFLHDQTGYSHRNLELQHSFSSRDAMISCTERTTISYIYSSRLWPSPLLGLVTSAPSSPIISVLVYMEIHTPAISNRSLWWSSSAALYIYHLFSSQGDLVANTWYFLQILLFGGPRKHKKIMIRSSSHEELKKPFFDNRKGE